MIGRVQLTDDSVNQSDSALLPASIDYWLDPPPSVTDLVEPSPLIQSRSFATGTLVSNRSGVTRRGKGVLL